MNPESILVGGVDDLGAGRAGVAVDAGDRLVLAVDIGGVAGVGGDDFAVLQSGMVEISAGGRFGLKLQHPGPINSKINRQSPGRGLVLGI